jgi:hypothetical protein
MNEELIEHWALMAHTIFAAEDAICKEWFPKLRATKDAPKEERERIAHEYCRAIAIEILSHATEEES